MTDNIQEIDEILERYRLHANMAYSEVEDNLRTAEEFKTLALPKVLAEAEQALLDWHNKQVEAVLDRLEAQWGETIDNTLGKPIRIKFVSVSAIEAERNKLKELDL